MRAHRGVALALLLSAFTAWEQYHRPQPSYDRYHLPDFDAWVYLAIAEHPSTFTVAPWGYRPLRSALIHALSSDDGGGARRLFRADRAVGLAGLTASGVLLFLFLRRLGNGEAPALLAVAAFGLSSPLARVVAEPFLTDTLTLPLVLAFLLAAELGAGDAVLALLALLGLLSKEIFFLFLPVVYLVRRDHRGRGQALLSVAAVGMPMLILTWLLKVWWTPYVRTPHAPYDLDLVRVTWDALCLGWTTHTAFFLLGGLVPLACLGALRSAARPYLVRYGYLAVATNLLPFTSWINAPQTEPGPLYTLRHMSYAVPFVLPLALLALDRVWPHFAPPAPVPASRPRPAARALAGAAVLVCLALPLASLDRYRRVPLHDRRYGPLVVTTCRESLRVARSLEEGAEVVWDMDELGFVWGQSDPGEMPQMRWFLLDGWGPHPFDSKDDVSLTGREASLALPTFGGADLDLVLSLSSAAPTPLEVAVNGRAAGVVAPVGERRDFAVRLPAALLYRGDNLIVLRRTDGSSGAVRLHAVTMRSVR